MSRNLNTCHVEELYAKRISREKGRPSIPSRIAFGKGNGIRLSGPKPGRRRKTEKEEDKAQVYKDSCDRNMVESRNGIAKRRYGFDLIMAYLADAGKTEAALQFHVPNVAHLVLAVV